MNAAQRSNYAEDLKYVQNPALWPVWPVLPMKAIDRQPGALPDCGLLFAEPRDNGYTLYLTNMWNPDMDNCPKQQFATADELLAKWQVD